MKFQEQYKNEMNSISPSDEQCQRIYSNVYKQIQGTQTTSNADNSDIVNYASALRPSRKNPLRLKAIAITGATAACVVLVAGIAIGQITGKNNAATGDAMQNNDAIAAGGSSSINDITDSSIWYDGDIPFIESSPKEEADNFTSAEEEPSANSNSAFDESTAFGDISNIRIIFYGNCSECILYSGNNAWKFTISSDNLQDFNSNYISISELQNNLGQTLHISLGKYSIAVTDEQHNPIGFFTQN